MKKHTQDFINRRLQLVMLKRQLLQILINL